MLHPRLHHATPSPHPTPTHPQDSIEALDFSNNELPKLENFPRMPRLKSLYLASNSISRVADGLGPALPALTTLILTGNRISGLGEVGALACFSKLTELSLLGNPVTRAPSYRHYVISRLPWLRVLDFSRVRKAERLEAVKWSLRPEGKAVVAEAAKRHAAGGKADVVEALASGVGASAEPAGGKPAITPAQLSRIHAAISAASDAAEIARIEGHLLRGECPPELVEERQGEGQATAGEGQATAGEADMEVG